VAGDGDNCDPVATVAVVFDSKFIFFVKFLSHLPVPIQAWIAQKPREPNIRRCVFFYIIQACMGR
jgi:hypothetical protein